MRASREQIQHEAVSRAASGQSFANWPAILTGFAAKGIPASDVRPRENVFTYHAWRALGRQVRRGEHGVKVLTFVDTGRREEEPADAADGNADTAQARKPGRPPWT